MNWYGKYDYDHEYSVQYHRVQKREVYENTFSIQIIL